MSEWRILKLSEICKIKYGKDHKKLSTGNIPVYGTGGIMRYVDTALFNKNSVLIPRKGSLDNLYFVESPFWTVDTLFYTDIDEDLVTPEFLYYQLKTLDLYEMNVGTAVPSLTTSVLNELDIAVPSLPLQEKIGKVLKVLDNKIAYNTAINHHLEQVAQAIFKSWFMDFEPTVPFTEAVQVLGGGTPKTTAAEYWYGSIPFFTPKDATELYVLATEKTLTEAGLNNCNSRLYPENTVFVTARGTVGKLAMAGVSMAMNQSCYALIGKSGYGQHFVYHLALETVKHLKNKASGAVFDAIVTRDFESELIAAPPIESRNEFEVKVKPIYEAILNNANESACLAALRNTLLPRLMSGELSVIDLSGEK